MQSTPQARGKGRCRWLWPPVLAFALAACNDENVSVQQRVAGGDPERGKAIVVAIGCGACHTIPGITGAYGIVGPPLDRFARRQLIAGIVPNKPEVLVEFVRNAPSVAPNTGMPDLPLTPMEARHVTAYLYTLR